MGASESAARNLEFAEIQEKLRSVDESMTKLMKTIDVVHGTAKVLDNYLRSQQAEIDESTCLDTVKKNVTSCKQSAFTLLCAVEESLTSQQAETFGVLSKFLQFATYELYSHGISPKELSFSKELDAYRDNTRKEEIQKDDCLQRLEKLQKENEEMKNYINTLNAKDVTYLEVELLNRKEIDLLKKKIEKLEQEKENYEKQIESNVFGVCANIKVQNQSKQYETQTHIKEKKYPEQKRANVSVTTGDPRLQKQMDVLRKSKTEPSSANKMEQLLHHTTFETNFQAMRSSWTENVSDLKTQINELRNEISEKNETLERQRLNYEQEIEKLKQSIKTLETSSNEMQNKIDIKDKELMQVRQGFEQILEEKKQGAVTEEVGTINELKTALQQLNNKYNEDMKSNSTEKNKLELALQNSKKDLKDFQKRGNEMQQETERLGCKITKLNEHIQGLCNENKAIKERTIVLEREIDECKQEKNTLQEEKKTLLAKITDQEISVLMYENCKMELDILKAKKCVQVQLYSSNRVDQICGVEVELKDMLKKNLESELLCVEFIQCAKQSEILPDVPVLLICITASRLGTDVAQVTQGLAITPKMALLIFHHKDIHALPTQASERVLTGTELKALGGIFDMAFLTGKGIHNCPLNKNNCISLVQFIKKEANIKPLL